MAKRDTGGSDPGNTGNGQDFEVLERHEVKEKKPNLYRVLLHNDDYTTMEFVVEVLVKVFNKQFSDATRIMLDVHTKGIGTVGVYTYDIAVTKVDQVHKMAEEREHPLRCSYEKA
jgi:ATP-dependent Clp protease adaptor protein ClpS